jgi:pyruvate kinase
MEPSEQVPGPVAPDLWCVADLRVAVETIRHHALEYESTFSEEIATIPAGYRNSARNLLHYLALRQQDIRELQRQLAMLGLSSLGRAEGHVLPTLDSVLAAISGLAGAPRYPETIVLRRQLAASHELKSHATQLLGSVPRNRQTRIMITMPSEAATQYELVRDLLNAGMDVMRVNCAHDDAQAWGAMIENLDRARRENAKPCKLLMDLGGPKLRTGPVMPGPMLVKIRPARDVRGRVVRPARIWLTPTHSALKSPEQSDAKLPITGTLLAASQPGDVLEIVDARGRTRSFTITESIDNARWARVDNTAYVETGCPVRLLRGEDIISDARIGTLPALDAPIRLSVGDLLNVTRDIVHGENASHDGDPRPAHIACLESRIFAEVKIGERVFFDDGKIAGQIVQAMPDRFTVRITQADQKGSKLAADKGINLPDTRFTFSAIQEKDLRDLEFVAAHADLVGLSFVQRPEEIESVRAELARHGRRDVGIILKIETRQAFEQLPWLLLAALRQMPAGVMVARGDLGVEMGFERLAEVQEEILWLCEAARLPAIWATQVLETMVKKGVPTRAEVTDAAMSVRAECVMLNKGPHLAEAVRFLSHVLQRMHGHQEKKNAMLRKLSISQIISGSMRQ